MNGTAWFTELPAGWDHVPLKHGASLGGARCTGRDAGDLYIGMEHIEPWTGRLAQRGERDAGCDLEAEGGSTFNRFESGDVLFGKLRPYLAKAVIAPANGVCSTELLVLKPQPYLSRRYLLYALLSQGFIRTVDSTTFGAKMPRAEWSLIGSLQIPVPPLSTQCAIADYLDRETGRIDALVAAKQRLLDVLTEKRRALIENAVTRGLIPDLPMRDSCIPWLGQIPEHWEVRRARWLFAERDERTDDGEGELLTVSHITGVTPRSEKDVNMFEAETKEGYKICRRGDLAINTMWAWMGAMGVSPVDGIVSPSYNVYVPNGDLISGYIDALVRIPQFTKEVVRHSKGVWSSRLRLYPEQFSQICLPIPPFAEQQAIVAYVDAETSKLDALRSSAERSIELLKERRAALVAAAITGQIDVPTAIGGQT